jgi:hypothetical protein
MTSKQAWKIYNLSVSENSHLVTFGAPSKNNNLFFRTRRKAAHLYIKKIRWIKNKTHNQVVFYGKNPEKQPQNIHITL